MALKAVMEMIPGFSSIKSRLPAGELDADHIGKVEAVIRSMTPGERRKLARFAPSRHIRGVATARPRRQRAHRLAPRGESPLR